MTDNRTRLAPIFYSSHAFCRSTRRSGFTLVETFFVMLFITLFTSLTLGYLQKVRSEARDVRRLADMNQFRSSLELFSHTQSAYPPGKSVLIGHEVRALDARGWSSEPQEPIYLARTPIDPLPTAIVPCVKSVPQPCAYSYTQNTPQDYSIRFYLEHGVPPLSAPGLYQLTARGFRP